MAKTPVEKLHEVFKVIRDEFVYDQDDPDGFGKQAYKEEMRKRKLMKRFAKK